MRARLARNWLAPQAQRLGVVQAQDLDVGDPQAKPLDHRQHLGQRGRVAAREDVLPDKGVGRARPVDAADRMQQRDSVVGQQVAYRAEELGIVPDADVLEHADRDDPVEPAAERAVIAQLEADAVGETGTRCALPADLELLPRQRDPYDLAGARLGQIEPEAAPARADVEHPHARL